MPEWVEAAYQHRQLLTKFTCVRKSEVVPVAWYQKKAEEPWAKRVQGMVRSMRTPLRNGDRAFLLLSDEKERVDGVVAFGDEPISDSEHGFNLNLIARHIECARCGIGHSALLKFTDSCFEIIEELPNVELAVFSAIAHKENAPAHVLLRDDGWESGEDLPEDPDYQAWRKTIRVD